MRHIKIAVYGIATRKLSTGKTTPVRGAASRQAVQRDDSRAPEERKKPVAEAAPRKEEGSKRNNQEVPEMAARQHSASNC